MSTMKRKIENKLIEKTINLPKRIKLTEEKCVPQEGNASYTLESKLVKKYNKFAQTINLKEKYKYHCHVHNVRYLMDKIRKERKYISSQNRNNLVENFRSLTVSETDFITPPSENIANSTSKIEENDDDPMKNQSIKEEKDVFKKPDKPITKGNNQRTDGGSINPLKCFAAQGTHEESALKKHKNIDVCNSTVLDNSSPCDFLTPKLSLSNLPKLLDGSFRTNDDEVELSHNLTSERMFKRYMYKRHMLPRKINFDVEEDIDFDEHELRHLPKKYKEIKSFVITKNEEKGNIVFQKGFDYVETDDDSNFDSDCDCSILDYLISESCSSGFSDSSSDDEFDLGIYNTTD